ncbi:MAG TPA: amidohydrolase family protein [Xanthobacteraceae bacterium]|jgi:cytosine/adenosine deaminase-related metal-dependent hydrolase|nr:amidohydrolase family protein [Xanthobacteraceae bacterium]
MTDLQPDLFAPSAFLLAPEHVLLRNGSATDQAIVVRDGLIADVGPRDAVIARNSDLTVHALPGHLVMPGFIDAHHHLTQSFGKALAFGEPSEIFRRIWVPLEASLDGHGVYLASKLAALESLRGGFTTVVDAGTRSEADVVAVARATQETGLRCVLGFICNDSGPAAGGRDRSTIVKAAEAHLARWKTGGLVHPSLAVSIPEVATDWMLHRLVSIAAEAGVIFQTHVNEHLVAVERSLVERGQRPLQHLAAANALGHNVLIAHSTLITPAELMLLARTDTAVAYNPVASTWKGNAVAPAEMMAELGIRFGIGTDGTRSDAFRMIEAAETLQRIAFGLGVGDFSTGGGWTWLDHATHEAADAVGLKDVTGEIAVGKAADFLVVAIDTPEFLPSWDLDWELVRYGNRDQIVAVLVGGKLRLWRGWPTDWDARALMREVAAVAGKAVATAPIKRIHPTSREHRATHRPGKRE